MVSVEIMTEIKVRGNVIVGVNQQWYSDGDSDGEINAKIDGLKPLRVEELDKSELIALGLDYNARFVAKAYLGRDGGDYNLYLIW